MLNANASKKRHLTFLFQIFFYFNVNITYVLKKNDYFHIYIIFLNELNDQNYLNFILNDFNILNTIN